jgi:5-methylcytosine-specific restriction protein A
MRTHRPLAVSKQGKTLREKQQANGRTLALNGKAWRTLRALVLSQQPLCEDCRERGIVKQAREVDHADNNPANNERSNLVGLCSPCHSRRTRRWMNGSEGKVIGCDENGVPLDPSHPWRQAVGKSPATEDGEPRPQPCAHGRI